MFEFTNYKPKVLFEKKNNKKLNNTFQLCWQSRVLPPKEALGAMLISSFMF